ncbi:PDR/VanB family oxidoreductase [Burkholderia sp. Bp8998]|uniref:PDR/VanB family oxidoreductase n=1 Tax=Burkholderia sp. Bp8998 TaxID=2184557 RepID=UPI000F5B5F8C|nr:PDR/VanB family oxidoreductase [Burkholderia sp. Bp8998]RQS14908.1 oxidoreductase [Burkholderia sp. Bp8998]
MLSGTLQVRVEEIRDEAPGIRSFRIVRADGEAFDPHQPGAHIDVYAPSGVIRQYSLCGDPARRDALWFAVKRETASRGGSRSLHEDVAVGSGLKIGRPRNLFKLRDDAREHLLIGAGIGITPLMSMAWHLSRERAPFTLHLFARDAAHAAFLPLLSSPPFAAHVEFHFGVDTHELDAELERCIRSAAEGAHLYTCGPSPFMDRVVAIGEARLGAGRVHLERFAAKPDAVPATNEAADSSGAPDTFDVQVARTGQVVRVDKGVSIVDALARIGIVIDTVCTEGICGTCIVDVVEGTPAHRDQCLDRSERASNRLICCCVSRSSSPLLVLDV